MDARSSKSACGGESISFDGNKKVHGRKHQVAVDSQGFLLGAFVHEAAPHDSKVMGGFLEELTAIWPTLKHAHVDSGYVGDASRHLAALGLSVTVPPKKGKQFQVQPLRWRVERFFAWLKNFRRLCSDFERSTRSTEAFIWLANVSLLLRRLCREPVVWKNRKGTN